MKVVVIGCTHAGTAAIKSILKNHPEAEVTVYKGSDNISFLSCGIALYVDGVAKDPTDLFYSDPEELSSLGVTVKMEHDVTNVDTENKTVTARDLRTGRTETASHDKLVITTGSWPIIPPINRIDAENVLLCKNYSQTNETIARAKEAKRVIIVGGGYIDIELVEAPVESGKQVTLIDGLGRILNKYLDRPPTDILEKKLIDRGVTPALGGNVTEFITDEKGEVKRIATPTNTFDTDMVVLCAGFRPNTKLTEGKVETPPNGVVKMSKYMQTSDPDILTAGDSVVVNYNPNDTRNCIPLATNAVCQGLLVGNNLTEHKMAYRGTQGTSGLYLFNWTIGSTRMTKESATLNDLEIQAAVFKDNYRPEFMPATEEVMMELVYEKGTSHVVDAQFMSGYGITQSANTMSLAIQNKMAMEDLTLSNFFFQPHLGRPWNYLSLLA